MDYMVNCNKPLIPTNPITQVASMPYTLYLSLQGKYFVGHVDNVEFDNCSLAWAGLINPSCSGVNLHVYVWTVTNYEVAPINANVWINSNPPGYPSISKSVTPANTSLCPLPEPHVKLLKVSNTKEDFECGVNAYGRIVPPESTIADDEDGKFIIPPGGSFIISLSNLKRSDACSKCSVAFGWSEEKIC